MAADCVLKVLFELEGVFIHPSSDEDGIEPDLLVSGTLRIVDKDAEVFVEYRPLEDAVDPSNMLCAGKDSSSVMEWDQCSGEKSKSLIETQQSYETEWDMINAVSFKKKTFTNGDGSVNPSQERSRWAFCVSVGDLRCVTLKAEGWSFLLLTLKEARSKLPTLHFHQGGSTQFLDSLGRVALLSPSPEDETCLLVSTPNRALSQSFENLLDDNNFGLVNKFRKDPYVTTLGGFSKVTNYIFDAFRGTEEQHQRPPEEVADLLSEVIPGLEINQQEEPGFEVITRMDLGPRPEVSRRPPLSAEDWTKHQDPEGRMTSGLCRLVRGRAWKFLLGYFPWDSTLEQRKVLQRDKTDEYFRMKLQWKSVSEEQERRNSRLRDYRSLIEKDVNRTDRTNRFYEGMDNPGLVLLHDILMTYCMYDFDLDSSLWNYLVVELTPLTHPSGTTSVRRLIPLVLPRYVDSSFWNYLESQDSGYLYFCFRWLLIRFKRELSFQDVLRLWEVMWTGLPCQNFHLLVCCSILDSEKQKIMEENYGFNEILKHINELSMKLDVEEILQKAEGISQQIQSCKDLPQSISSILGLEPDLCGSDPTHSGASPPLRPRPPLRRPDTHTSTSTSTSNGLLRASSAHNGCTVAFSS
ncbi:LOW QUALITY PROTEIN: TBC1 domain family member 15 [Perca fluviatilis]|uniref:LOW QUALITY PROTEIN: TBC1 domain family member 15 n=1 Tax=Perca fluviatilis TaxID=8168 RepID=UPI0019648340|nr:LOW QUALITY PROTEIN: TBC1 domain family member 15 [Perca fluviatilis]